MVNPHRSSRLGERGQAVEYSLILVLIAIGLVAVLGLVGKSTKRVYAKNSSAMALPSGYPTSDVGTALPSSFSVGVTPASPTAPPDSTGGAESPDSLSNPPDSLSLLTHSR
jgi:Flp pilus assembly pilin Flp